MPRGRVEKLVLLHLDFKTEVSRQVKISVLQDLRQKYENLKSLITERDVVWNDSFLDSIEAENLVMTPVKELAAQILEMQSQGSMA